MTLLLENLPQSLAPQGERLIRCLEAMNRENWRQQGLTQHHNWWPELHREACRHWGTAPDPAVLAYATSHQTVRADLKDLTASA